MILSNTCKYGVRATIYLALKKNKNEKTGIKKIAEDLDMPTPFLGKILQQLARHKVLSSTKGPHGGFGLGMKPEEIKLIDIVKIIDGEEVFNTCLINLKSCSTKEHEKSPCPLHKRFSPIRNQIIELFNNQTIAELAEDIENNEGLEV
ncbi:MAG: Rrf2 family transcriptional regulator [Bacteroidota bacterium]|nr:Rrf2 family transcriptional regulator [Bacteroidota bacterium]